jgi:hypothetical protein
MNIAAKKSVQKAMDILRHASYCEQKCGVKDCSEMKKLKDKNLFTFLFSNFLLDFSLILHVNECFMKDDGECNICREMIALIVAHSRSCRHPACKIQFCLKIKARIERDARDKHLSLKRRLDQSPDTTAAFCKPGTVSFKITSCMQLISKTFIAVEQQCRITKNISMQPRRNSITTVATVTELQLFCIC